VLLRALLLVASSALALAASCNKPSEPDRSESAPKASAASPTPSAQPADVAYQAPAAWPKADNPSPMRKATFRVPRAAGDPEDGELSVSQAGGGIDRNLERWAGQFGAQLGDVKRTVLDPGGLRVTVVQIHGAYTGMAMPGAPVQGAKPGYALLGAIVETAPPTFFKLTGPERTVTAAQPDFDKLVASLRAK
jgi:hypothetical protein